MDESKQGDGGLVNLSELTDFQFGPAWARGGSEEPLRASLLRAEERRERRGSASRTGGAGRSGDIRRSGDRERREGDAPSFRRSRHDRDGRSERGRDRRDGRSERPRRELPQPAEGFRVELRPENSILEIFSSEILKKKRAHPLLDLANIVMADKKRYDLVFMRLEKGSMLIHSTKGDGACWLTEAEALAYLWKAPWFGEFYRSEEVETEAPKGAFTAVASCTLGNEVIGPVNWHGYQAALMNLYRSRYAHMSLEAFRSRIAITKSEEAVASWLAAASHKTVWRPTREGAAETELSDARAVEADFREHHYDQVYEITDKVFINGATPRRLLSPGLAAHLSILSDKTRRSPQMLIPNLCHGLARHHMPIYKWQGNHFTGPSRVRAIPADMVLADRMAAIVEWSKAHSGQPVEEMFAELSGVPAGTDEASGKAAAEAHAPYAADMLWLLEQGFLVVTSDNAVWYPKGGAAPAPVTPTKGRRGKGGSRPQGKKAESPAPQSSTPGSNEPVPVAEPVQEPTATDTPTADAPTTDAPAVDTPAEDTPAADTPAADTPTEDTPVAGTPATDTPAVDASTADVPAEDVPAADAPAADTPSTEDSPTA